MSRAKASTTGLNKVATTRAKRSPRQNPRKSPSSSPKPGNTAARKFRKPRAPAETALIHSMLAKMDPCTTPPKSLKGAIEACVMPNPRSNSKPADLYETVCSYIQGTLANGHSTDPAADVLANRKFPVHDKKEPSWRRVRETVIFNLVAKPLGLLLEPSRKPVHIGIIAEKLRRVACTDEFYSALFGGGFALGSSSYPPLFGASRAKLFKGDESEWLDKNGGKPFMTKGGTVFFSPEAAKRSSSSSSTSKKKKGGKAGAAAKRSPTIVSFCPANEKKAHTAPAAASPLFVLRPGSADHIEAFEAFVASSGTEAANLDDAFQEWTPMAQIILLLCSLGGEGSPALTPAQLKNVKHIVGKVAQKMPKLKSAATAFRVKQRVLNVFKAALPHIKKHIDCGNSDDDSGEDDLNAYVSPGGDVTSGKKGSNALPDTIIAKTAEQPAIRKQGQQPIHGTQGDIRGQDIRGQANRPGQSKQIYMRGDQSLDTQQGSKKHGQQGQLQQRSKKQESLIGQKRHGQVQGGPVQQSQNQGGPPGRGPSPGQNAQLKTQAQNRQHQKGQNPQEMPGQGGPVQQPQKQGGPPGQGLYTGQKAQSQPHLQKTQQHNDADASGDDDGKTPQSSSHRQQRVRQRMQSQEQKKARQEQEERRDKAAADALVEGGLTIYAPDTPKRADPKKPYILAYIPDDVSFLSAPAQIWPPVPGSIYERLANCVRDLKIEINFVENSIYSQLEHAEYRGMLYPFRNMVGDNNSRKAALVLVALLQSMSNTMPPKTRETALDAVHIYLQAPPADKPAVSSLSAGNTARILYIDTSTNSSAWRCTLYHLGRGGTRVVPVGVVYSAERKWYQNASSEHDTDLSQVTVYGYEQKPVTFSVGAPRHGRTDLLPPDDLARVYSTADIAIRLAAFAHLPIGRSTVLRAEKFLNSFPEGYAALRYIDMCLCDRWDIYTEYTNIKASGVTWTETNGRDSQEHFIYNMLLAGLKGPCTLDIASRKTISRDHSICAGFFASYLNPPQSSGDTPSRTLKDIWAAGRARMHNLSDSTLDQPCEDDRSRGLICRDSTHFTLIDADYNRWSGVFLEQPQIWDMAMFMLTDVPNRHGCSIQFDTYEGEGEINPSWGIMPILYACRDLAADKTQPAGSTPRPTKPLILNRAVCLRLSEEDGHFAAYALRAHETKPETIYMDYYDSMTDTNFIATDIAIDRMEAVFEKLARYFKLTPEFRLIRGPRQAGSTDCGLFSIAFVINAYITAPEFADPATKTHLAPLKFQTSDICTKNGSRCLNEWGNGTRHDMFGERAIATGKARNERTKADEAAKKYQTANITTNQRNYTNAKRRADKAAADARRVAGEWKPSSLAQ